MSSPLAAWRDGIGRVARAPAILIGVWALTLLVSLPLALGLRGMLEQHLGRSLAAETAASGVNYEWWQEFSDQATGLGVTFRPTIIGFGAVLDNLSGDATTLEPQFLKALSDAAITCIYSPSFANCKVGQTIKRAVKH